MSFTIIALIAAGCGWVAIMAWGCYKDLTQDGPTNEIGDNGHDNV